MNNLQVFKNNLFGEVRAVEIDGEPWLVGKDVAEILGYSNASKAVLTHVDDEDKTFVMLNIADSQNGNVSVGQSKTAFINESGLYSLVLSSKLPSAKKFRRWITSEVIPSIRKHGGYISGQETMSDEELMAKALLMAQSKIAEKDRLLEEQKPKVLFADAVAASSSSILIGDLAKLLRQNNIQTGQRRLFDWLRDNGYLIKQKGSSWNMPTQKAMELKLFEVKETTITHADGHISISKTVKVTGKGQQYFLNKFLTA